MIRGRTIGKLAREAGVGVETVRYYERRGLLQRPLSQSGSGFREYDDRAVALIRHVRLAQKLGFTLKDVELLIARSGDESTFCPTFQIAVADKLAEVTAELERLTGLAVELGEVLTQCRGRIQTDACPILRSLKSEKEIFHGR